MLALSTRSAGFCSGLQAAQAEVDAANAAPELWKAQLTDGGLSGQHAAFYRLLDKVNEWYPARVPLEQVWGIGRPLWDPLSRVHGRQPLRLSADHSCLLCGLVDVRRGQC